MGDETLSKENAYLKRLAKIDNKNQEKSRLLARSVRKDATFDELRHIMKFSDDDTRAHMAGCPWMQIEILRELYHDYPKTIDFNDQTPAHLLDKYIDEGDAERLAVYQSKKRTDEQLVRIVQKSGIRLSCSIADSGSLLPEEAIQILFARNNRSITKRLRAALIRSISTNTEAEKAIRSLSRELELPEWFIRSTWLSS